MTQTTDAPFNPLATPAAPRGANYTPQGCRFVVFAHAERVGITVTHPGTRRVRRADLTPVEGEPNVWEVHLEGDLRGWSYAYDLDRDGETLGGIVDPWARLVHNGMGYVCCDKTGVSPRPAFDPRDAIIYELHLRDFTRDPRCGVKEEWRGRYLGLAQQGTRLERTQMSTGLDHILELGVTVVQLMPVHSFAMPYNPAYEWGYMPLDFNAPHAGYASAVELEAPVREFKRLVSALHEAGLRVTVDVVYNHTAEAWPDHLHGLMALAPTEYFRFRDDGTTWNGSGTGNEFRSESNEGRRFIVESCLYWVKELGVDGFRFDLMGLIDGETMRQLTEAVQAVDPTIMVYGEPWTGGETPIHVTHKGVQRGKGWGCFNDDIRDGLRGEVFDVDDLGFLVAGHGIPRVKSGILGGVTTFAESPLETINYIECHDNHTLADRLELVANKQGPASTEEDRQRMNMLGAFILLTSQGIPFLHSGQEFGRSKEGQDNSYNLGDGINNIRWSDKAARHHLFTFYRNMVAVRREHPMFRLRDAEQIREAVKFLDDDLKMYVPEGTIAYLLEDVSGEDAWSRAVLMFNGTAQDVEMPLPGGTWHIAALDGYAGEAKRPQTRTFDLHRHRGALFYQPRSEGR